MSKRDLQKFGKKLKFLRLEKGLTQLELAEILDMSPNFVGMLERGERNTTIENVFKIARALGIKPSNLFEELWLLFLIFCSKFWKANNNHH